jgi:hypothetical protein
MTLSEVKAAIGDWSLQESGVRGWCASSPSWEHDGIVVTADSGEQLVERIANLTRVVCTWARTGPTVKPSCARMRPRPRTRTREGE